MLACVAALAALALLVCAGHIRHGGFYYDDWGVLALGRFPPAGGLLHGLWLYYGQRPAQVLYYAAFDGLIGAHAAARLAVAAAMVVLQASLLYVLLRRVGMRIWEAFACAALCLAFPFSDSVWLWGILSLTSFAISAALLGVILALRALERRGARALLLHALSLALFVVSILSYEVFAVAGCLAGLLYVRAVGLARAKRRWALDVIAILATLLLARAVLPIDVATPSRTQSLAGALAHAGLIAAAGARTLGAALLPLAGVGPWIGAGVLAATLLVAACMYRSPRAPAELGRWLAFAAAGLLLAVAAWAVYVPAPDHYLPSAAGTVNRVNALAAIGIAVLVYSALMLLAHMLARVAGLRFAPAVVASALAVALCGAYALRTAGDVRAWDAAAGDQRTVLADLHAALPRPPAQAVIFAYDAPLRVGPGVPVLNTTLDLTSAVRVSYARPRLSAVPIAAGDLRCGAAAPSSAGVPGVYGHAYVVDVRARRAVDLRGPAQCASLIARASFASRSAPVT